jgi:hypothetical protein
LVVTVLSHRCNSRTDSAEAKVESHASYETRPCQATLLASPGSPTNVWEETPSKWGLKSGCLDPARHRGLLERHGARKYTGRPKKPSPNPDNAGPIVRHLMGLPVASV